jgi:molybdenum cofactor cytidylyltransferase
LGIDLLSSIILAAGQSIRMGERVKALLPIGDTTFLERIVSHLQQSDIEELIIILGAQHELILKKLKPEVSKVLINDGWKKGQLSSLRLGIRSLSHQSEGVLFTLVDHPLVQISTYRTLIDFWKKDRRRIVIPMYKGRKGHPAIFPAWLYEDLQHQELPNGARDIIQRERDSVIFVPVPDSGVVDDIDTLDDYQRLIGELA